MLGRVATQWTILKVWQDSQESGRLVYRFTWFTKGLLVVLTGHPHIGLSDSPRTLSDVGQGPYLCLTESSQQINSMSFF